MKKNIVALMLFSVITSVNAEMVAPGVELVSHKTWTTGNASGHVEDKKVFFSMSSVYARASVSSVYGLVYQNIQMRGDHSFSIQNTSNGVKQYNISMKLCADGSNCTYDSRTYNVSSGGSFYSGATTYLTTSFSRVGSYSLVASTFISGDTSSSDVSNATITVSK